MRAALSPPPLLVLSCAGFLLAACAAPAGGGTDIRAASDTARMCFDGSRVRNFTTPRHDMLLVRSVENRVFELSTVGACPDMTGSIQLAIDPDSSASISLCPGDLARVTELRTGAPQPCRMRVNRVLSQDQVEALPRRDRP